VQSVLITTKVVGPNPVRGEVYSIQHFVIKYIPPYLSKFPSSSIKALLAASINLYRQINIIIVFILSASNKKIMTKKNFIEIQVNICKGILYTYKQSPLQR
jgi:hypothetical protein